MPAFNEAKTIQEVVARVGQGVRDLEIVLVNDASSDTHAGIVEDDLASSTSGAS